MAGIGGFADRVDSPQPSLAPTLEPEIQDANRDQCWPEGVAEARAPSCESLSDLLDGIASPVPGMV